MEPRLLQSGFRIGFTILAIALVSLPFQPRGSAEFVATVLAILVSGTLVIGVALLARVAHPSPPHDKRRPSGYNERPHRRKR